MMPNGEPTSVEQQPGSPFVPMMPAHEERRIVAWHEAAYEEARATARKAQRFHYLDRIIEVPPGVQPITPMSHLLGQAVLDEVRDSDRVLDMGTGSGVNAILAATTSRDVVAVDINPEALRSARHNAALNDVEDRIRVVESDVFTDVEGPFDLIVFDPPFRWLRPRDALEAATTDEGYGTLTGFFTNARQNLSTEGRVLLFFGTTGDHRYLAHLISSHGFRSTVVAEDWLERDGWRVRYFTLLLT